MVWCIKCGYEFDPNDKGKVAIKAIMRERRVVCGDGSLIVGNRFSCIMDGKCAAAVIRNFAGGLELAKKNYEEIRNNDEEDLKVYYLKHPDRAKDIDNKSESIESLDDWCAFCGSLFKSETPGTSTAERAMLYQLSTNKTYEIKHFSICRQCKSEIDKFMSDGNEGAKKRTKLLMGSDYVDYDPIFKSG